MSSAAPTTGRGRVRLPRHLRGTTVALVLVITLIAFEGQLPWTG